MVDKFGSDQQQLANSGGSVISQDNAVLINGDSDGEDALLFGPAALREIQAGVANGSFAIPPSDSEATITADNALPYWTFTDVNSAGAITAALVADTGAASGYVLRFTVASGTTTGKSATLTRFVPVASSASRSFSFYAEATFESGTNSTQSNAQISMTFYKTDQTTVTGSTFSSDLYGFNLLVTPNGITAPNLYSTTPGIANVTAPADAAFIKLTITIATVATQSAVRTVDLTEVRLAHGLPELLLTDKTSPATRAPAYITNDDGALTIIEGTGDSQFYLYAATTTTTGAGVQTIGNFAIDSETISANVQDNILLSSGADITAQATTTVDITGPSGVNVSGRLNSTSGITNTGTITSTSHITGGRFYPSNQATRYIEDNGTYLRAINDFWAVGSLFQTTSGIRVPVIRVGEAAAASTSIPGNGSLVVTVTFPALPTTPNFAVLGIRWAGSDSNATVVCSAFSSTSTVTARLYNQTGTAITSSRAINYVVGAEN
jgi:hypothetical protein